MYKAGKICRLRRKGVARGHVERNLTQTRPEERIGLGLHFSFPIFLQLRVRSLGQSEMGHAAVTWGLILRFVSFIHPH